MASQVAHASMGVLLNACYKGATHNDDNEPIDQMYTLNLKAGSPLQAWISGSFTKICVSVNSEAELLALHDKAKGLGMLNCLITDNGVTEFNGVPTKTCLAIGPDTVENVDRITSGLPLL